MFTTEQRELAGVSLVSELGLPTESKHDSDQTYEHANEIALNQRDLRKLDGDLTDALWNPYDIIKKIFTEQDYRTISKDEALNIPYRKDIPYGKAA